MISTTACHVQDPDLPVDEDEYGDDLGEGDAHEEDEDEEEAQQQSTDMPQPGKEAQTPSQDPSQSASRQPQVYPSAFAYHMCALQALFEK